MTRFRLGTIAALAGILITTGGCAGSATAPEAATGTANLSVSHRAARADSVAANPTSNGDELTTLESGYMGAGTR